MFTFFFWFNIFKISAKKNIILLYCGLDFIKDKRFFIFLLLKRFNMVELTKPNPLLLAIPIIDKDYLFFNFNS